MRKLTVAERKWLVDQVISGRCSSAKLAKKYQFDRKNLNNWVSSIKKGARLQNARGRAASFDAESMKALHEFLENNTGCTAKDLIQLLEAEYQLSFKRRNNISDGDEHQLKIPSLPVTTRRRYLKKLLK